MKRGGNIIETELKQLNNLYSKLLKFQKQYDAARLWEVYHGLTWPELPILNTYRQNVFNTQNEINNLMTDLTNKYDVKFIEMLEKIIFSGIKKD